MYNGPSHIKGHCQWCRMWNELQTHRPKYKRQLQGHIVQLPERRSRDYKARGPKYQHLQDAVTSLLCTNWQRHSSVWGAALWCMAHIVPCTAAVVSLGLRGPSPHRALSCRRAQRACLSGQSSGVWDNSLRCLSYAAASPEVWLVQLRKWTPNCINFHSVQFQFK